MQYVTGYLKFITDPTQRSVSYSATQMSTSIQADIGRSSSLPGSITLAATENYKPQEEHQPSTRLTLQSPSGPSNSNGNSLVVQHDCSQLQSSIKEEKIQANIRNNQQPFNLESKAVINHTGKSYTKFQSGMYNIVLNICNFITILQYHLLRKSWL